MRSDKKKTRKHANELDGKTWLRYSVSIWSDIRKTKEEKELGKDAIGIEISPEFAKIAERRVDQLRAPYIRFSSLQ